MMISAVTIVFLAALVLLFSVADAASEGYWLSADIPNLRSEKESIKFISNLDTLHIFMWSESIDASNMRKQEYEINFYSGEKYNGELKVNADGIFVASVDFGGPGGGPLGDAIIKLKLEDDDKNKLLYKYIELTRVDTNRASKVPIEVGIEEMKESVPPTTMPTTSRHPSATPTSKPTVSMRPTLSPTMSPTKVPSASPSVTCVPCSNDPSVPMASRNRTCEGFRLMERKCKEPTYSWRKNKVCKLSCFMNGYKYDDDNCCTDVNTRSETEEIEKSVPESAEIIEVSKKLPNDNNADSNTSSNKANVDDSNMKVEAILDVEDDNIEDENVKDEDTVYENRMKKHYNDTTCFDEYHCSRDRLSHNERLESGDAICSRDGRLMFGMDYDGTLQWKDCTTGETELYQIYCIR